MFFVQASTLPRACTKKPTKREGCCMQNDQFPTKSPVESKDNSIMSGQVLRILGGSGLHELSELCGLVGV